MEGLDGLEGPLLSCGPPFWPTQGYGDRVPHRQSGVWHRLGLITAGEPLQGSHVPSHVLVLAWIPPLHQLTPERQRLARPLAPALLQVPLVRRQRAGRTCRVATLSCLRRGPILVHRLPVQVQG